ncbi:MAG: phosphoglycerate kinase [Patescibacteria group bacterium]
MKFLSSLTKKDLQNKICLLRVDLNIQNADLRGQTRGTTRKQNWHLRILAVLPTIEFLIGNGAKVVILSHRGRPQKVSSIKYQVSSYTLKPFAKILSSLFKKPVHFIEGTTFHAWNVEGDIFLLENLRFLKDEEENSGKLAKQLASLGDIYINDAFAVSHRKNASVAAITKFLPSYAGLLLEKEIKNLDKAMKSPKKPLIVILGGAKISDKIGMVKNFLNRADYFLVGGGMANTFLAAQGLPVGDSLYDKNADLRGLIRGLTRKIVLPVDVVIYKRQILDIGPKTIEKYLKIIENAETIIWNGPMGYIEDKKFRKGSEAIAKAIIKSKAFSVIGGGETASIFQNSKLKTQNSKLFLSTGGGAMLEYLAGKKLPGIEALN